MSNPTGRPITKLFINDSVTSDSTTWSSLKIDSEFTGDVAGKVDRAGDTMTGALVVPSLRIGASNLINLTPDGTQGIFVNSTRNDNVATLRFRTAGITGSQRIALGYSTLDNYVLESYDALQAVRDASFRIRDVRFNRDLLFYNPVGNFTELGNGGSLRLQGTIVNPILQSEFVSTTQNQVAILASRAVSQTSSFKVCGGHSSGSTPSTANRKWEIDSLTGGITIAASSVTTGATFADYAEYFENVTLGKIPLGTIVELKSKMGEHSYVGPATGSGFLGVVSGTAGIRLGDAPFHWQGRYLLGPYGEPLYEEIQYGEGPVETTKTIKVLKENPLWDPTQEYQPRSERPEEWSLVALIGQVYVRCRNSVAMGMYLSADGSGYGVPSGILGTSPTKLKAMSYKGRDPEDETIYIWRCLLA